MMKAVADYLTDIRDALERASREGGDKQGCWTSINMTNSLLGALVKQEGGISDARHAFLNAIEAYTGGKNVTASLYQTQEQEQASYEKALDALKALSASLDKAEPTLMAKDTADTRQVETPF